MLSISNEAASTVPKANDSPFADCLSTARLRFDQRTQHFAVPALRMFDVEHSVESEVKTLFGWNPESLQRWECWMMSASVASKREHGAWKRPAMRQKRP